MKTIFFDLDDTLYDRSVPYRAAFAQFFGGRDTARAADAFAAFVKRGYEVFEAAHTGRMSMEQMYLYRHQKGLEDVGIAVTDADALTLQALYAAQQQRITLSVDMVAVLELCRVRFAAIGVITNGGGQAQRAKLTQLGLPRWVAPELVLISDECGVMKPDLEIFRMAERAAGCAPERLIYVGDSLRTDIAPAAARGWQTVWLDRKQTARPSAATATAQSEAELLDCLRRLT